MVEGFPSTSRFDARRRLGSGAFGVVYEAFDRDRQLLVALKTLRSAQSDALYLFKREFRSLADLNHPNLVALYELLTEGREWFFTMELLHGRSFIEHAWDIPSRSPEATTDTPTRPTLTTRLSVVPSGPREERALQPRADVAIGGALDHERVREAFLQLAAGLNALHDAGKLHRDIKPRNVMVTFEGRVVLLDFGLVADVATDTANPMSLRVAGTPAYMAPEQAAAGAAQTASDWYSVGAMLYEILTGRLPFHGSAWDILADKQRLDPPPLEASASGVPDDLASLCRELLARDPAVRPTGRDVMARLSGSTATPERAGSARRLAPAHTFVGRDAELRALDEAYAGMTAGRATVIYIDGLSGMGKTTLVQHFLQDLRSRAPDTLVLTGRCYQQESVPYKGFDLLVDELSQWLSDTDAQTVGALLPRDVHALVQLFPVLSRVEAIAGARRRSLDLPDAQEQRRRASAAFRELLVGIAEQRPLVLFVDDLQWSDLDSTYLLGELLRPPNPPSLLFVGAYRSDEAETSPALRALLALHRTGQVSVDTREIPLRELGPTEVEQVVAAVVGADRLPGLTGLVQRESGGNPFFVVELARLAASQRRDADARDINLDSAMFARISTLGAPARRLLDILALAARPLVPRVALQAARMEPADFGVLTSLRVAQLVRARETDRKEAVELYHDRIREVIGRAIAPDQAVEMHEHLAAALEASGDADPEMLVHHFSQAGRFDRAAEHAVVAADRAAAALAFDRAARLYELAIRLLPDSAELPSLRMKRANALANAGRGGDAGRAFLAAAEGVDQDRFIELQRRAAEQFLITGHLGDGLTALNSVLRAVGMRLAPTQHAAMIQLLIRRAIIRLRGLSFRERATSTLPPRQLLRIDSCWSVAVGLAFVDSMRAADFQARHCLLALRSGEPLRIARALALEVGYSSLGGTRTQRRTQSVARTAVSLSQRLGTPHAIGLASLTTGIAAHMEGRWRASLDLCERADIVFRESCTGVTWELDTARLHIVSNTFFLGDLKSLRNLAPAMIKNADDRGDLYGSTALILRTAFIDTLMHDEPERAAERVNQAESPWSELGFLMQHYWGLMARLDILAYTGHGADALDLIRDRWKPMAASQLLRVQFSFIEAFYRRARSSLMAARELAASSPRRAELLDQVTRDTKRLTREPVDWGSGLGYLIDAGALMTRGDTERAMVSVSRAEEKLARAGMELHLALTRRAKGRLLGGDRGNALIAASDEWLRASGVTDPLAFQRMIAGWD